MDTKKHFQLLLTIFKIIKPNFKRCFFRKAPFFMNSSWLFWLKRKLAILSLIESFYELHSSATEEEKNKKQA